MAGEEPKYGVTGGARRRVHQKVVCVKFSKLVMVGVRWFIEVTQRSIPLFDRE